MSTLPYKLPTTDQRTVPPDLAPENQSMYLLGLLTELG